LQAARLPLQFEQCSWTPTNFAKDWSPYSRRNFEKLGELGAAGSIWQHGKPIVDLYGGFCDARHEKPWKADTLVLIWSATKGIGSACVLQVLQEHRVGIDRCVAEFWPEFAQAGKENITLSQLLSHQTGLCALDRRVDVVDLRRCYPSTRGAETLVAAGNRTWLSCSHVWVPSR